MVSHRHEREKGQSSLVLLAFISFLILGAGFIAKFAGEDDVASQTRTAADAAALAGADDVVDDLVGQLLAVPPTLNAGCSLGRSAASQYAQRNDARLTYYCFDLGTGTATAEVAIDKPGGGVETLTSSARLRALPSCSERPTPTTTPTPEDDDEDESPETPEPTEPPDPIFDCTIAGLDGVFTPAGGFDIDAVKRLMEPRLVS